MQHDSLANDVLALYALSSSASSASSACNVATTLNVITSLERLFVAVQVLLHTRDNILDPTHLHRELENLRTFALQHITHPLRVVLHSIQQKRSNLLRDIPRLTAQRTQLAQQLQQIKKTLTAQLAASETSTSPQASMYVHELRSTLDALSQCDGDVRLLEDVASTLQPPSSSSSSSSSSSITTPLFHLALRSLINERTACLRDIRQAGMAELDALGKQHERLRNELRIRKQTTTLLLRDELSRTLHSVPSMDDVNSFTLEIDNKESLLTQLWTTCTQSCNDLCLLVAEEINILLRSKQDKKIHHAEQCMPLLGSLRAALQDLARASNCSSTLSYLTNTTPNTTPATQQDNSMLLMQGVLGRDSPVATDTFSSNNSNIITTNTAMFVLPSTHESGMMMDSNAVVGVLVPQTYRVQHTASGDMDSRLLQSAQVHATRLNEMYELFHQQFRRLNALNDMNAAAANIYATVLACWQALCVLLPHLQKRGESILAVSDMVSSAPASCRTVTQTQHVRESATSIKALTELSTSCRPRASWHSDYVQCKDQLVYCARACVESITSIRKAVQQYEARMCELETRWIASARLLDAQTLAKIHALQTRTSNALAKFALQLKHELRLAELPVQRAAVAVRCLASSVSSVSALSCSESGNPSLQKQMLVELTDGMVAHAASTHNNMSIANNDDDKDGKKQKTDSNISVLCQRARELCSVLVATSLHLLTLQNQEHVLGAVCSDVFELQKYVEQCYATFRVVLGRPSLFVEFNSTNVLSPAPLPPPPPAAPVSVSVSVTQTTTSPSSSSSSSQTPQPALSPPLPQPTTVPVKSPAASLPPLPQTTLPAPSLANIAPLSRVFKLPPPIPPVPSASSTKKTPATPAATDGSLNANPTPTRIAPEQMALLVVDQF